jgi:conjugal transfer pilus assembly protein TraU
MVKLAPILMIITLHLYANCTGRFVNPITDICWSCLFPITLGGMRISANNEDTPNPKQLICKCYNPLRIGIPVSFWEPSRLVDVTRTPYCLVSMGFSLPKNTGIKQRGSVGNGSQGRMRSSFYQVHWYMYPVLYWLELLADFVCVEKEKIDVAYITELDPLWNDDKMTYIFTPEAGLFSAPIMQAACAADCIASSTGFSQETGLVGVPHCAGCQGSLYPFSGTISAHTGGVQASLLLVQRMIAKLHRQGMLRRTIGEDALCDGAKATFIVKNQYKTQMVYPVPSTQKPGCYPLGRSETLWGRGKEIPYKGEDFGYLIWRKKACCMG